VSQSEYLIDRHRVIFDGGVGWHCVCAEFVKLGDCKHTRESAGRRAAQDLIRNRVKPAFGTLAMFSNRAADPTG
jgi:hypothetical protein